MRLAEPEARNRVLEVAAGTCLFGRAVAPHVKEVVCLDATDEMLEVGRRQALEDELSNMTFVRGFAENLPFEDASFEMVLNRLAFHHFTEMEKPFSEMVPSL